MSPQELLRYVWTHPANRHRQLQAVVDTFGWQFRKRCLKTPRTLRVFDQYQMRCYPDSFGAGVMIYTGGCPDYDDMSFIRRYLRPGDAFVDVGANIGIYTLLAASCVGAEGKVLALEAGRRAYDRLGENLRLNSLTQVEARFAAVGAQAGTIRFLQQHDLINRIAVDADSDQAGGKVEEVPCVTLDETLAETKYAMGKIDIEGAEPLAFQGGEQMLTRGNPPVWLVELKDRLLQRFDSSADEFAAMLERFRYRLGVYDADRRELSFPPTPWKSHGNVLAVHEASVSDVQARLNAASPA